MIYQCNQKSYYAYIDNLDGLKFMILLFCVLLFYKSLYSYDMNLLFLDVFLIIIYTC